MLHEAKLPLIDQSVASKKAKKEGPDAKAQGKRT
jgi:hypothetical protein